MPDDQLNLCGKLVQEIFAELPPHDTFIQLNFGLKRVMQANAYCAKALVVSLHEKSELRFDFGHPFMTVQQHPVEFINNFDFANAGRTFILVNIPSPSSARSSSEKVHVEFSDLDLRELAAALLELDQAYVLINAYPMPVLDRCLSVWRAKEFNTGYRENAPSRQKIWMNYQPPEKLAVSVFGTNAADRQRIKRKAERWAAKYGKLDYAERTAVLLAVLDVHVAID